MEVKSANPKLKQSEIAKVLKKSSSTLQPYKNDINMPSAYRLLQTSNTHTEEKQRLRMT